MNKPLGWIALALLGWACSQSSVAASSEVGWARRIGSSLPLETSLRDENGHPIQLTEVFGNHPVILTFAYYTCPNLCTLVLNAEMDAVLAAKLSPGRDVKLVTISIDPAETPRLAQMKQRTYLAKLKSAILGDSAIQQDQTRASLVEWRFLTGDQRSIQALTQAAGFSYRYEPRTRSFVHPSGLLVLSPQGRINEQMSGIRFDPRELKRALTHAQPRAMAPAAGQNPITLPCASGALDQSSRGRAILLLIRGLGGLTILLMAWGLSKALRSERPEASSS